MPESCIGFSPTSPSWRTRGSWFLRSWADCWSRVIDASPGCTSRRPCGRRRSSSPAAIEFAGWICPLTPLENWFRARAGLAGYGSGFVEHYILPLLYPTALTREVQVVLGVSVLVVNAGIYCWVVRRGKRES
jgi:hypothetical protein